MLGTLIASAPVQTGMCVCERERESERERENPNDHYFQQEAQTRALFDLRAAHYGFRAFRSKVSQTVGRWRRGRWRVEGWDSMSAMVICMRACMHVGVRGHVSAYVYTCIRVCVGGVHDCSASDT